MVEESYLIGELARLTGVSVRTIRYYIEEGLLPAPRIQGKYAVYDEEYTDRIQLIRYLKNAYLPLREIRRMLDSMGGQEIRTMLGRYERGENVVLPSNIELYTPDGQSAVDYISDVLKKQPGRDMRDADLSPMPGKPPSTPLPTPQPAPRFSITDPFRGSAAWRRFTIAPGVELHIEEAQHPPSDDKIFRLLMFARKLFHGDQS